MQQNTPPLGVPLTWSQTWIQVLTQPSDLTFQAILTDPTASNGRAYTWVAVSAFIRQALGLLVSLPVLIRFATEGFPNVRGGSAFSALTGMAAGFSVLGIVLAPLFAVLGLILTVGITQFIAKSMGGTGTYDQLTYAFASYLAPLGLVSTAVAFTPVALCLSLPLTIYGAVLSVMAVKGVNNFSWERAIFSVFFIPIVIFAVAICVFLFALASMHGAR